MNEDIYKESTQNIPLLQRLNQKKSTVISMFYKYKSSQCPLPVLNPEKYIIVLGQILSPHIVQTNTRKFEDVLITHMNAFETFTLLVHFVYRSDFANLPNTSLTTDCGWGCAIRSCQMLLANAVTKIYGKEHIQMKTLIKRFLDFYHVKCPYSIHSFFTTTSILTSTINGNSHLPITVCCSALTDLVSRDENEIFKCYMVKESIEIERVEKPTIIFVPFSLPDGFIGELEVVFSFPSFCYFRLFIVYV